VRDHDEPNEEDRHLQGDAGMPPAEEAADDRDAQQIDRGRASLPRRGPFSRRRSILR
jgi:hypothetical protein